MVCAGCRCLVATHYQGLGSSQVRGSSVGTYKLEADIDNDGGLAFTYKVKVSSVVHGASGHVSVM